MLVIDPPQFGLVFRQNDRTQEVDRMLQPLIAGGQWIFMLDADRAVIADEA
jgi:hypothetical protein